MEQHSDFYFLKNCNNIAYCVSCHNKISLKNFEWINMQLNENLLKKHILLT